VQVQVHVAIELAAEAQRLRASANVTERGLRDSCITSRAGRDGELALAVEKPALPW